MTKYTKVGYSKPKATPIEPNNNVLCNYGCNKPALFIFSNGKLCCSQHQNTCSGKIERYKKIQSQTDVDGITKSKKAAIASLNTRTQRGITISSQIKGAKTRTENGFYKRHSKRMQQLWEHGVPWDLHQQTPIKRFKSTTLPYQGTYEFDFLEQLEQQYGLAWVEQNVQRGPRLYYPVPDGEELKIYLPDFLVERTKIYEIKSSWWWNKNGTDINLQQININKLLAAQLQGYEVYLVLDGKRIQIDENNETFAMV